MVNDVQWFVGIDWATQSHCVCLLDAEGRRVGEREFAHVDQRRRQERVRRAMFLHRGQERVDRRLPDHHDASALGQDGEAQHASGMWPMVVAHVVGALTTILIWSVRRRAWDVLVGASRARIPVLRRLVRLTMAGPAIAAGWLQWMASRRRGPPGWVCV